jgi:hypothetical protein
MMRFTAIFASAILFSVSALAAPATDDGFQFDTVGSMSLKAPTEATPQEMSGIWYSLKTAQSDAGRVAILKYAAKKYFFRALQVTALVEVIGDETERADAIATLQARLTNPEQVERLTELLPQRALTEKAVVTERDAQTAGL